MVFVGLDLHKTFSRITAMDATGKIIEGLRIDNEIEEIANFFKSFDEPVKVAIEASSSWYWIVDLLQDLEVDVKLSHPLKTKAIASAKVKTDKIDATILAHLLRCDLLPTAYIPPKEVRETRDLLRYRAVLVRVRTQFKNRIHCILRKFNIKNPFTDLFGKKGLEFLQDLPVPETYQTFVNDYLSIIGLLNSKIDKATKTINQMVEHDPKARLLCELPGVSYYTALLILMEISDVTRFSDEHHLCSYAGLTPSVHASGDRVFAGRITKQGSPWLRWILVEAAQKVGNNPKNPFHRLYQQIAKKKGKGTAKVAVARKILTAAYYMLSKNEHFKPNKSLKVARSG